MNNGASAPFLLVVVDEGSCFFPKRRGEKLHTQRHTKLGVQLFGNRLQIGAAIRSIFERIPAPCRPHHRSTGRQHSHGNRAHGIGIPTKGNNTPEQVLRNRIVFLQCRERCIDTIQPLDRNTTGVHGSRAKPTKTIPNGRLHSTASNVQDRRLRSAHPQRVIQASSASMMPSRHGNRQGGRFSFGCVVRDGRLQGRNTAYVIQMRQVRLHRTAHGRATTGTGSVDRFQKHVHVAALLQKMKQSPGIGLAWVPMERA